MSGAIAARFEAAEPLNELWPAPDMSVLSAGRRSAVAMPSDMFGSVWPLLRDLAEGAGAPVDYVAQGFISVAASLIGGKRWAQPYATSDWRQPCVIWSALVGDPSTNKSPALDAVTGPLGAMEADHAVDHKADLLRWETQCERAKVEHSAWADNVKAAQRENLATPLKPEEACQPEEPMRRRLKVRDATQEAVAMILCGNPQGTLLAADELAGWLLNFDRYSGGGERAFWLEAHGGRQYVVDRKGAKGPITVPFNGVSVVGGIQPEKLGECVLMGPDDGFAARFLWAWPDPIPYERPRHIADTARLDGILRRLDGLRWGIRQNAEQVPITLAFDDPAADLFEAWMKENHRGGDDLGSLYKGFVGKLGGVVIRLSLFAELLRWAADCGDDEPHSISVRTVAAAVEFVEGYAKPTALRVFGDAALPKVERNAASLARYIQKHKPRAVNARSIYRDWGIPGLAKDAAATTEAIALLVDADWLKPAGQRAGETHGRKSADYAVNPAVFGAR